MSHQLVRQLSNQIIREYHRNELKFVNKNEKSHHQTWSDILVDLNQIIWFMVEKTSDLIDYWFNDVYKNRLTCLTFKFLNSINLCKWLQRLYCKCRKNIFRSSIRSSIKSSIRSSTKSSIRSSNGWIQCTS